MLVRRRDGNSFNFPRPSHDRARTDSLVFVGPLDVSSARESESAGFPAHATARAAISATFGYQDNAMPRDEMFAAVTRITRARRSLSLQTSRTATVSNHMISLPRILDASAVDAIWRTLYIENSKIPSAMLNGWPKCGRQGRSPHTPESRHKCLTSPSRNPPSTGRVVMSPRASSASILSLRRPKRSIRAEIPGPINAIADPERTALKELAELGITHITFGPILQRAAMAAAKSTADHLIGSDGGRESEIAEKRSGT
jgi:hypothetical protein